MREQFFARLIFLCDHDTLLHNRMLSKARIDPVEFDAVPENLDLEVELPETLNVSIGPVARQIPNPIEPGFRLI